MSEKAPTPSNKDLEALLATLTEADVENFVVGASEQSALVKEFKANRQSPKVLSAFLEYLKGQKDTFELMLNKSTAGKAREIAQKKLEAIDKNLPIVEAAVAELKKEEEKTPPPPDTSKKTSATTEDPTAKKTKTSPTIQELREKKAPNFGRLFVGQEFTKTDPQGNLLGYIKISGGNKYSKAKEKGPYYKRDDDTRTPYFRINGTINIGTDAEETFNEKEITKQNLEKLLHAGFSKYDEKAENAKASEEKEKVKLPDPEEARAEEIKSQFTDLVVSQENASIGTRKKQKDLFDAFEKETSVEWLQKNIPHYQRYKQLVTNPDHLSIWRDQLGKQEAYLRTIEFDPSDNKYYRQEIKTSGKNKETKRLEYVEVSEEERNRIQEDIAFLKARLTGKEIDAALRVAKEKLAALEAKGEGPKTEKYITAQKAYFKAVERKALQQYELGQRDTPEQKIAIENLENRLDKVELKIEEFEERIETINAQKKGSGIELGGESGKKFIQQFASQIEDFAKKLPGQSGIQFKANIAESRLLSPEKSRPDELVFQFVLDRKYKNNADESFAKRLLQGANNWRKGALGSIAVNFSVQIRDGKLVFNENPSRGKKDLDVWEIGGDSIVTIEDGRAKHELENLIRKMDAVLTEENPMQKTMWIDQRTKKLMTYTGSAIPGFDPTKPAQELSKEEKELYEKLLDRRDEIEERLEALGETRETGDDEEEEEEEEENPTSPITVEDSEKVEVDPEESDESETNNQESQISIPENISQYFNPDAETFRKSVIISIDDALEKRSRGNLSLENTIAILRETIGTNKLVEKLITDEWKSLEKQLAGAPETLGNGGYYETKEDISKRMRRFALNPIQELILIQQNKKEYNRDIFNFFARTEKKLAALLSAFEVSQKVLLKMGDKEFLAQVLAENPNILNDQEKADMRTDPLAAALSTPYISKAVKERLSAIDKKYNPGRQKIIGGISEEVSELININNSGQILRTLRTYTPEDLDALRIQSTNEWYFSFIQEERKHTAFFTSSGFSLQLLNFKEVATEQDGVQVYSDKARYTLISPSGSVIAENIQGYFDASRKMREEAEKHFDSLFKDKPAKEAGRSGELAEKLATFKKEIEAFNPTLISEVEKLLGEEEMDAFIEKSTTVGEFLTALEPVLEVRALAAENQETLEEVPLDEAKNWIVEELSNAGKTINKVRAVILGPNRFDIVINPGETSEETIGVDFDSMNDEANRLLKYLEGVLSKQITGVRMNSSRGVFLVETKASE